MQQLEPTDQITQAVTRATELGRLLSKQARRPFVLEVTGTPKAGKSTVIEFVESFLRDCGWRVHVLRERASLCPLPMKGHFFFNTWTLGTMLAGLLEAVDSKSDLVIVDRGLFDSLIWLQMQADFGQASDDETRAFQSFATLKRWRDLVDLVALFEVSPATAMARENSRRLRKRIGSVMQVPFLSTFNKAMATVRANNVGMFEFCDVSNNEGPQAGALNLIDSILQHARAWVDPEIAVLPRARALDLVNGFVDWTDTGLGEIIEATRFDLRSHVEDDDSLVQLLACGVQTHDDKVLVSARSGKRDDAPRPRDKTARIWTGCHVEKRDGGQLNESVLKEQLLERMRQDLHLGRLDANAAVAGFGWTPDEGERRHLGRKPPTGCLDASCAGCR